MLTRRLAFGVATLALSATAAAAGQRMTIGAKVGPYLASWGGADVNEFEAALPGSVSSRRSVSAGGFLSLPSPFGGQIRLQPELLYVGKGATVECCGGSATVQVEYLEVPVLIVVVPRVVGSLLPRAFFGPEVAVKLSCSGNDSSGSTKCSDAGLQIKGTDYGLIFGGTLGLAMGLGEVFIEARYDLGLGTFFDISPSVAISNRGFAFMAGYAVKVGQ